MKFSFEYNPSTRTKRILHVDNVDPRYMALETVQDKQPYYESNQKIRNMGWKLEVPDWGCAVADIPNDDFTALCEEYPDLRAKGPGSSEIRQAALRKILTTHPKRHLWLWRHNFYGKKKRI